MKMLAGRKFALKDVALVVVVVVLAGGAMFGAGEAFLRRYERRRATVPGTFPLMYYRNTRHAYALIRGYDYFGWVHIDSQGFRGPEVSVAKPPGTFRIIAIGASTTFDVCAGRDADAWPARLQYWLDSLAPTRRFEVINAGVPGYLAIDDIVRLQSDLYRFSPDAIILYTGHNNLARALDLTARRAGPSPTTPNEALTATPWDDWMTRHSLLYNKVSLRLKALMTTRRYGAVRTKSVITPEQWSSALERAARNFKRDVVSFILIANSMGIRVIVPEVVQMAGEGPTSEIDAASKAAWAGGTTAAPLEAVIEGYRRFNAVEHAVADSLGATFIPTNSFHLVGPSLYCAGTDPLHFNGAGSESMGRQLAMALLKSDALRPAGTPTRSVK